MWIGLNDIESEDTLAWKNGEAYLFSSWDDAGSANDEATDCVVMTTGFKYQNKTCTDTQVEGYLCMKGAISLPQYTYEKQINSNSRYMEKYTKEIVFDNVNKDYNGVKCCSHCGIAFANTDIVSFSSRQCWCGLYGGENKYVFHVFLTSFDMFRLMDWWV